MHCAEDKSSEDEVDDERAGTHVTHKHASFGHAYNCIDQSAKDRTNDMSQLDENMHHEC